MKISVLILLFTVSLFAKDTTYTTQQILDYIQKPTTLPDVKLSARGRGGYGTSEFLYEEPQTDLYGGVLLQLDLLSSADIRKKKEVQNQKRAEVLALLSDIKGHLNLTWQFQKQRKAYTERLDWYKKRIEIGKENHTAVYPIEKILIELNTKIYKEQNEIQKTQLAVASLAGDKWESLYDIVQAWDRNL